MANPQKRKGAGFELEVVKWHKDRGYDSEKQPLSGALGGKFSGDVRVEGMISECKRRKKSFTSLYDALAQGGGNDLLFVRDDGKEMLVVMPAETYECFLKWSFNKNNR